MKIITMQMAAVLLWAANSPSSVLAVDCLPANISLQTQQQVNNFQTAHGPGCNRVTGNLGITNGADIVDLSPLSGLTEIVGSLAVENLESLSSLAGLHNISTTGDLWVGNNYVLENLVGLDQLAVVKGIFGVSRNDNLKNLNGLPALETIWWGYWVELNPELISLQGAPQASVWFYNDIRITRNPKLQNLIGGPIFEQPQILDITSNASLTSLKDIVVVDNSKIEVVTLGGLPLIENLEGIEWLVTTVYLAVNGNDSMTSLSGLNNLISTVTLQFISNNSLMDLSALSSLVSVGNLPMGSSLITNLRIEDNNSLARLNGLEQLEYVEGTVRIKGNPRLFDCRALKRLADATDDGVAGPGPGESGIPDVGSYFSVFGNSPSCNSLDFVDFIFLDGMEP